MSKVRKIEGLGVKDGDGHYPRPEESVLDVTQAVARPHPSSDLNKGSTIEFHIKVKPNERIRLVVIFSLFFSLF